MKVPELLQSALPIFEFNEVHAVNIRAAPERVWQVLQGYEYDQSPVFRFLFGLRRLAAWPGLFNRRRAAAWDIGRSTLAKSEPFVKVSEKPNEEVVLGLIGKFWQPLPKAISLADGEAFLNFADPAYAKAAMNFHLTLIEPALTQLSTETRIHVPDAVSRTWFRLYWAVIGFFSGLIRVDMLRRIKAAAEKPGL